MLGFIVGLICGGLSAWMTFDATGDSAVAAVVGIICFFLGWLFGLAVLTNGDW